MGALGRRSEEPSTLNAARGQGGRRHPARAEPGIPGEERRANLSALPKTGRGSGATSCEEAGDSFLPAQFSQWEVQNSSRETLQQYVPTGRNRLSANHGWEVTIVSED